MVKNCTSFLSEEFIWKDMAVCFPLENITVNSVKHNQAVPWQSLYTMKKEDNGIDLVDMWVVPASYPFLLLHRHFVKLLKPKGPVPFRLSQV